MSKNIVKDIDGAHSYLHGVLRAKYIIEEISQEKNQKFMLVKVSENLHLLNHENWTQAINRLIASGDFTLLNIPS